MSPAGNKRLQSGTYGVCLRLKPTFTSALMSACSRIQARIAAVNTALTALGMWAMAIPGIGLLSLFVFICSFIPIAGVFFSTVPIAFVALTEYGFIKVRHNCCHS